MLEQGKMIMLLRKGMNKMGVLKLRSHFALPYLRASTTLLLKPDYASQVEPVASGWHPETVRIGSWAEITDILVTEQTVGSLLLPFHIWNEQFLAIEMETTTATLYTLLRTYKLAQAQFLIVQNMAVVSHGLIWLNQFLLPMQCQS